jgi:hypothetical protein
MARVALALSLLGSISNAYGNGHLDGLLGLTTPPAVAGPNTTSEPQAPSATYERAPGFGAIVPTSTTSSPTETSLAWWQSTTERIVYVNPDDPRLPADCNLMSNDGQKWFCSPFDGE